MLTRQKRENYTKSSKNDLFMKRQAMTPVLRLFLPSLLVIATCIFLFSLGIWQLQRLEWKQNLIAQITERPLMPPVGFDDAVSPKTTMQDTMIWRRLRLTGHFDHAKTAFVFTVLSDPKGAYEGPGYWIMTPFIIQTTQAVIWVNRGFVPEQQIDTYKENDDKPDNIVAVEGLIRPSEEPNFMTPADEPAQNIFFIRNTDNLSIAKKLDLQKVAPFSIDLLEGQDANTAPLPQAGESRLTYTNPHLGYALTWFGLAIVLFVMYTAFIYMRLSPKARLHDTP
jgi:surfeit locus 1 family protein